MSGSMRATGLCALDHRKVEWERKRRCEKLLAEPQSSPPVMRARQVAPPLTRHAGSVTPDE